MHLPLAQPQVQDVARLPRRRHDRMIHAPVIVAVPGAARLFPVDLDRQAVDVDDQRLRRRHPPIAFSRHPASRCNPSRSTSTPSFADHAATRRDSVGCEGRRPALPSGAVPARSPVASRNAGSSRSSVASLCSRRPCPASSRSVRASRFCECRIRRPSRLSGNRFARTAPPRCASAARARQSPESPVIRSRRDPILIDLLKLNGASIIFTPDVMAGRCSRYL